MNTELRVTNLLIGVILVVMAHFTGNGVTTEIMAQTLHTVGILMAFKFFTLTEVNQK